MNKLNVLNILTGLDQQSSHQNQPMKCSLIENKVLYNKVYCFQLNMIANLLNVSNKNKPCG